MQIIEDNACKIDFKKIKIKKVLYAADFMKKKK